MAFHQAGRLAEAEQIYRRILQAQPEQFDCLHLLGVVYAQRGDFAEAVRQIDAALRINPNVAAVHNNRGGALLELQRPDEALASYERSIALKPNFAEAFYGRGNAFRQLQRPHEALASYDRAIALRPNYPEAYNNQGFLLWELKRPDEALASYDRAIALKPDYPEAFNNRGIALRELKRPDEALASYDRAIALKPNHAEAFNNRGIVLWELKRPDEALSSCEQAIALKPDYAEAFNSRGNAFRELKRPDEALASYDRAIAFNPHYAEAYNNRGILLSELKRLDEALASYERAIALKADYAEAFNNRGDPLRRLLRLDEALASYDRAIALKPDYADAFYNHGVVLVDLRRLDEALASFDRAVAAKADHRYAFGRAADCVITLCDWDRRTRFAADLNAHVSGKKSIVPPFGLLGYSDDPGLHLQCARNYIDDTVPLPPRPLWTGETWRHDKLRVAYLSADFRRHAVAYLMAGLFEQHDRSRFEIIGVSFGVDDGSEMRERLVAAFDQFYDVRTKSDEEVAKLLHDRQVDIVIDLMGYTHDARPGILAYRPAPIHVSYLGFPATMGAEFIDYIIADAIVLPFDQRSYYTENIVHLPDCYQVSDSKRPIASRMPAREALGLPGEGFVFCCFNNSWKIAPPVFDIWMRLLKAVDRSVLWLSPDNATAEANLRREAQYRGVDPGRLMFMRRVEYADYLVRYRLADLFLDTLPYNAGATASDALWAGLPVITCSGHAFTARMAGSLLHGAGLPELVTHSLEDYEALALRLAKDPVLLEGYRKRLVTNRLTHPLFDADRFRRHVEAAYTTMWEKWQRGEPPASFSVEQLGPLVGR
ncbi:MAG: tetratricopeptide repeat protein [Xanthobacteraceae bacterium]